MVVLPTSERAGGDPAVAAIERVLEAERAGNMRLESCAERAKQTVADARAEAAAITRRADERLARVHDHYLKRIGHKVETLKTASDTGAAAQGPVSDAVLAEAARRLAAKLTV